MTNYYKVKDKIWDAVKHSDNEAFDQACEEMIDKAGNEWWRIGWCIAPSTLDEVDDLVIKAAKEAHRLWRKAIEEGDAPAEDVSPAEGILQVLNVIDPKRYEKESEAAMIDSLIDEYGK